ncbi:transglutaminase family protein [Nocardioides dilutus]
MVMPRSRASLVSLATLSTLSVATTWVAMLSWRGFVEHSSRFLGPLLLLGAVLVASGTLARWWRSPAAVVVLAQTLATAVAASLMLTGSPLPVGAAWTRLTDKFEAAVDSANQFASPVPADVPPVDPILVVGGLGCMLLVDFLACTLRRVPLAGVPLLTIFSVPLSMLGSGPSWYVFAPTAAGFIAMLFVHEDEQVSRWGRSLLRDQGGVDADAFGVRTGSVRRTAGVIGGVVTTLAIVVPAAIPTLQLQVFDFGPGSGGSGDIDINNPMVDLRRDLIRGADKDLLRVVTDDPDPSYLRIAVLNRFSSEAWSSGDRDVPSSNQASGQMPSLEGVDPSVTRQEFDYAISATDDFSSTWLPTQSLISRIEAPGDWRYDEDTRDFLASDDGLDTAGLEWEFSSIELNLDAADLAVAPTAAGQVSDEFTDLPSGLAEEIRQLTLDVTEKAPSRFEKAVALQNWFRRGGGFTYDDSAVLANGADDLLAFLSEGPGGRTGYCEQFAASMAVMARILGIPARVAVGFLRPQQVGTGTYVYSAHDLHAWPELYIAGAGWVRFEPTPGGRAESVPDYTTQPVIIPSDEPTTNPSEEDIANPPVRDSASPSAAGDDETAGAGSGSDIPWLLVLLILLVVTLLLALALAPRAMRRRRRATRLRGGPEDAWLELRDTARDLGLTWPRDRSPRQTADTLVRWFGAPPDEFTPERPRRGPEVNSDAVVALDRIVLALELSRYAERDPGADGAWRADAETCVVALTGGATLRTRRRAEWWPRSLFARERVVSRPPSDDEDSQRPAYAGVVDHVG